MILALVSSGRSDLRELGADEGGKALVAGRGDLLDRAASRPRRAAFSKAVPRTVITFLASDDLTVAMALPA